MTISKEQALETLQKRRNANAKKEKIDNAALQAGSPMYYYCHGCNAEQRLRETHLASEIKTFCDDCQELIDSGTITAEELRAGNP